jgi:hypothetical protein
VLARQLFADSTSFANVVQVAVAHVLENPAIASGTWIRNQFGLVAERYLGVVEVHRNYIAGFEGVF